MGFALLNLLRRLAGLPIGVGLLSLVLLWSETGILTAASEALVFLEPATRSLEVGETATLSITIDAGAQPVDAAQAYLNFDPLYLQVVDTAGNPVVSITPGSIFAQNGGTWTDILQNSVDNATGQVGFAGGKGVGGQAADRRFNLATISFKAIRPPPSEGTHVTFATEDPRRRSKIAQGFNTVTGELVGATLLPTGTTPVAEPPRTRAPLPTPTPVSIPPTAEPTAIIAGVPGGTAVIPAESQPLPSPIAAATPTPAPQPQPKGRIFGCGLTSETAGGTLDGSILALAAGLVGLLFRKRTGK